MTGPSPAAAEPGAVFVYGTLLPGHLRWPLLEPHATGWQDATVPGRLFDTGDGWPAAVFDAGGGAVPGALVELVPERIAEVLAALDEVEDVPELFVRQAVETAAGASAWAWGWPHPVADFEAIEAWSGRAER